MTSAVFLATALAFVGLIAINGARARILPDSLGLEVATLANYGGTYSPPPPSPIPSPGTTELTGNYEKYSSPPPESPKADPSIGQVTPSYGRTTPSPPPPPKPASPKAQLEIGSPCTDGCISMITNLERPVPSSPPSPKPASPTRQITFDLEPKVHAGPPPGQNVFST
ncbi:PREDICTED: leucine-rich repeat extensin-like protein 3 [Populus euphratica]|uniref:Leucine-rich repeat extensin-like protein 3 n=1 Tax=Populus euphratica TaxID=75702 RepID=A0AAJ6U0T2_POPEU|nr:PREDICTED: leucine-rich repeat extensin-like protein 3 [Populus euphratica]